MIPGRPTHWWHRWELSATPANRTELAAGLAEAWNSDPQRFTTRRGALRVVRFYERDLKLPVRYWIRRVGGPGE